MGLKLVSFATDAQPTLIRYDDSKLKSDQDGIETPGRRSISRPQAGRLKSDQDGIETAVAGVELICHAHAPSAGGRAALKSDQYGIETTSRPAACPGSPVEIGPIWD